MTAVSIAICTHNRANFLVKALESIRMQSYEFDKLEIILVNNGSTDHTEEVVRNHMEMSPITTRYEFLSDSSLSKARNLAIEIFAGDLLFFLDDDAIAEPDWVQCMVDVFETRRNVGSVGGRIEPIWEVDPGFLADNEFNYMFSVFNEHGDNRLMDGNLVPVGANFAMSRQAIKDTGLFNINLGRMGKKLLSGEERDYLLRMRELGHGLYYCPNAVVHHFVPKERLNSKWVLNRAYWGGRGHATVEFGLMDKRVKRTEVMKQLAHCIQFGLFAILQSHNTKKRLMFAREVSARWGVVVGLLKSLRADEEVTSAILAGIHSPVDVSTENQRTVG